MSKHSAYKGYEIHKQHVGNCGWNVAIDGKTAQGMTGFSTLAEAKQWINDEIESEEMLNEIDA
jgi:hypothetical protein